LTKNVRVFSTSVCPKCRELKAFLASRGIDFEECDMGDPGNMLHLMAYDGWPVDNAAPTLEILDPDNYESPSCYTHFDLFERGRLKTEFISGIFGVGMMVSP
jgi:Glutaredoxin